MLRCGRVCLVKNCYVINAQKQRVSPRIKKEGPTNVIVSLFDVSSSWEKQQILAVKLGISKALCLKVILWHAACLPECLKMCCMHLERTKKKKRGSTSVMTAGCIKEQCCLNSKRKHSATMLPQTLFLPQKHKRW